MSPVPRQKEFFARPTPTPGTVFVNDRVCVQTEEERVVLVPWHHLFPLSHRRSRRRGLRHGCTFRNGIRGSERYRTLLRLLGPNASPLSRAPQGWWTERASAPGRTTRRHSFRAQEKNHERNQTILRLKAEGMSNRWIAGRLGLGGKNGPQESPSARLEI